MAGLLAITQLWITLVFLIGAGTSNILDWESTAAGITLTVASAISLVAGLWKRPLKRGLGNTLIIVGAALATIWFWAVVVTPVAIIVIIGVIVSQVRASSRDAETR